MKYKFFHKLEFEPSIVWKILRYIKMTGIARTFSKINGTYHLKANIGFSGNYWENNKRTRTNTKSSVAIIGCGYFAYANIAYYLRKENTFFFKMYYGYGYCKGSVFMFKI